MTYQEILEGWKASKNEWSSYHDKARKIAAMIVKL